MLSAPVATTTDDLEAIDPAVPPSCRFDQVVHVGPPDDGARQASGDWRLAT